VALRHAPWSTSKVKCAQKCAQEFHFRYVDKIPEPAVGPAVRIGKVVHGALEKVLAHAPMETVLEEGRRELLNDEEKARFEELAKSVEKFGERIADFRRRKQVTNEFVEHKLAVRADLRATVFHAKDAFFRGVWDAGFVFDDAVAVVDHKTGMRRPASEFADQLGGYALLAAAHLKQTRRVWLGIHFVEAGEMEWTQPVALADVNQTYAPKLVEGIEQAAANVARGPIPQINEYCSFCSYHAICPAMRATDGVAPPPRREPVQLAFPTA
jgi:CRISPR/Cas system-associated exonuclease Cas4 (RecB family)